MRHGLFCGTHDNYPCDCGVMQRENDYGQVTPPYGTQIVCECGAAKLGAQPFGPEHSRWCPLATPPEQESPGA
jgi:hypothetical protein